MKEIVAASSGIDSPGFALRAVPSFEGLIP